MDTLLIFCLFLTIPLTKVEGFAQVGALKGILGAVLKLGAVLQF